MILGLYRLLSPLLAALQPLAARFSPKLAATLRWRRETRAALAGSFPAAGASSLWIHAASAGELEQALPLLAALRERDPQAFLLLTLGSASARRVAENLREADLIVPLPPDTPSAMARLCERFRPRVLLLIKWDVWPNLVLEVERIGSSVLLVGAVLSARSGRVRWPGRLLAAPLHRRLTAIGAASEEDARQFRAQGVAGDRIQVSGDTRFERVIARRAEARPHPLSMAGPRGPCLVAGSTWPKEGAALIAHFAELRRTHPELRLVLVPHEPHPARLAELTARARAAGLPCGLLSEQSTLSPGALCLVDRVGILPELYALGDLAYVGGGFGKGVHSVLEPAARGLPVMMGPRIGRADEARRLAAAGGAFVLSRLDEIRPRWEAFLLDPQALAGASRSATAFVESGRGALERSLALIDAHLAAKDAGDAP